MGKMDISKMVCLFPFDDRISDNVLPAHMHQPQIDESALIAMQQHMAQQAAFSQIPDVVKGVSGPHRVTNS